MNKVLYVYLKYFYKKNFAFCIWNNFYKYFTQHRDQTEANGQLELMNPALGFFLQIIEYTINFEYWYGI